MNRIVTLVLTAGLLLTAAPLSAQQWPPLDDLPDVEKTGSGDIAVVVAVEDYAFLPDVPGATRNAADWERFLADGLGVDKVLMLTNQQAVREEILGFAGRAAGAVQEGSTVWFVFIGHGGPSKQGDDGLLIGADGQQNANSMQARGVSQKELIEALEKGKQGKTVVLIDACFSGRDGSGGSLAKGTMPVVAVDSKPKVSNSTVVMTAAKGDEFAGALPEANRPAFSYLVLGAMRGWANGGDATVTADEAVTFARRELLGIPGRQQTPQLTGANSLVLTRGAIEAKPQPADAVVAADPQPVADTTSTTATAADTTTDASAANEDDGPFFANIQAGPMLNAGGAIGFAALAGLGFDVAAGIRLGGLLGVATPADPGVRQGNMLPSDRGGEAEVDGSETNGTHKPAFVLAPSVGYTLNGANSPMLVWMDVFAGLILARPCQAYKLQTDPKRKVVCDGTRSAQPAFMYGTRLAAQYSVLSVGGSVAIRPTESVQDLMLMFTAGLAFD